MNKLKNNVFFKYTSLFLCLIVLYVVSLILTALYPEKAEKYVKYHIAYSADRMLENEADWVFFFTKNISSKTDNYADSLMMHITYCSDILPPFKSALAGAMYGDTYAGSQLTQLARTARGDPTSDLIYYSRYWHGYRLWLKPLFIFFDYMQIRLFNMYVFFGLLVLCCIYLYKKSGWKLPLALVITMAALNIVLIPMNLMFSCVFVISFIACMLAVRVNERRPANLGLLFFATGSATMFFDFYSYPFLTLGFPLVCVLSMRLKDESTLKSIMKLSLSCIGAWLLGYFLTWFANVGLSHLALGAQDTGATIEVVKARLTDENSSTGSLPAIWDFMRKARRAIKVSLNELLIIPHVYVLGTVSILSTILIIFFREKNIKYRKLLAYLPLIILPALWYAVASQPAIQHVYFQYRGMGLWVMAILAILFYLIDFSRIISLTKKLFQKKDKKT